MKRYMMLILVTSIFFFSNKKRAPLNDIKKLLEEMAETDVELKNEPNGLRFSF